MEFQAETFEEISEMSKKHGMEMFQKSDQAHLNAMNKMREIGKEPGAFERWFNERKAEFEALPEVEKN